MGAGDGPQNDRHAAAAWLVPPSLGLCCLAGCSGVQSALDPAGDEARGIAFLFWVMVAAGIAIWLAVVGLLVYASRRSGPAASEQHASRLIFWGGAVFPSVSLFLLLGFAIWLMPGLRPFAEPAETALRIEVTGRQFWWRVVYHPAGGAPVESANEIRLPVGQRVEFTLKADDVIHSFWIPPLGGKMDMIPGRENRISLVADRPGHYRGPCAEFCGSSHALMAFSAVAMPAGDFEAWLRRQAAPSPGVSAGGADLFLHHGCGACHRVAGTGAAGAAGPDLSHVGSRDTLGAGILPNEVEVIERFIVEPQRIKPGSHMPSFAMLPAEDVAAIAAWLKGLE